MNKIYFFLIMPWMGLLLGFDCSDSFSCKPIKSPSTDEYSLALVLNHGAASDYVLELYDLNTGNLVQSKTMYFAPNKEEVAFTNVLPSTYLVYFSSAGCNKKKSISGKGIILE